MKCGKDIYTTAECAKITHLSIGTIVKSIDAGRLEAYTVPDSTHRRVTRRSLIKFIKEYNLPVNKYLLEDGNED
jgi:excisionase family DNA binding protein